MLYFIVLILIFALVFLWIGYGLSAPKHIGPVTDHFDGRKFINPGNVKPQGLREVIRWMLNREKGEWTVLKNTAYGKAPEERISRGIRITFINHSTFLIQTDDLNILTDPVYSERASPFSWIGPRRMRPPGIRFEDLPRIDVVLLSHNHYDHLDVATVKKLNEAFHPEFVVPLGVGAFLKQNHIDAYRELDWWQDLSLRDSLSISAVPAQHFSGRGFFDRDATLWCGYIIRGKNGTVYFAGDTGYNDQTFQEIGARAAPIDVAIIPIGAYKPAWFMSPVHCSPDEAVRIHRDVKARRSVASHYGTLPLADEGQLEPVKDLKKAKQKYGLAEKDFIPLREGEYEDF
jgi:L-ascorbate metabolism protein UlaG (beta-lactamase superfamily)